MERKIGEIFEHNGEWYQCISDTTNDNCNNCFFQKSCSNITGDCSSIARSDGKSVCFKKLEKVGEPITVNGKNVQLLKTNIANCDNCAFYKDVNCDFTCYPRKCYGGEEGTYVEIKTKEDMGDNDDIRPYDELFSPGTVSNTKYLVKEDMEEKKLNLKPFDIQKARAGKPVCTRGGRKARIIYFDAKGDYPIVALIETENGEKVVQYIIDGHCTNIISQCYDDLMMLPEKKEGTYVEIKTKEDMEEKKLNLKPFDIQKARAGKPVCTRGGRKARIICFDREAEQPIVALIENNGVESIDTFFLNGHTCFKSKEVAGDLMMLPEKKEGWVNVYKGGLLDTKSYPTKKEAFDKACTEGYVDTIKISWEE